jgi:hypothetical protein
MTAQTPTSSQGFPITPQQDRRCHDCVHCKQKCGVLAYCELGFWQKADGSPKTITLSRLKRSKLTMQAVWCPEFEEA